MTKWGDLRSIIGVQEHCLQNTDDACEYALAYKLRNRIWYRLGDMVGENIAGAMLSLVGAI